MTGPATPTPVPLRTGTGPPLLLLHATLSSSAELGGLAARLSPDFSVIRVDRRGSGQSAPPPGSDLRPIDVATHVDDLVAIIEAEVDAPILVAAHSYGGCLALELAARQPSLVRAVWVFEPPYALVGPADVKGELERVGRTTMDAYARAGERAAAETFLAGVAGPDVVAALSDQARERIGAQGAAAVADASLLGLDPGGLRRIRCPVRIVTGAASRPAYSAIAAGLLERIPSAVHERLDGADHMAPLIRPGVVAASIRAMMGS